MKTRPFFAMFALAAALLSSCAPAAATPLPTMSESHRQSSSLPAAPQQSQPLPAATAAAAEQYNNSSAPAPLAYPTSIALPTSMPTSTYLDGSESVQPTQPPITDQGNEFQGYDINGYENASRDHLSTFALDVDTASYSVARKYIQEGSLPPAEAIRVEEFLNSFEQGYASPENKGFALYADGAPSPFLSDGTYLIRFGVQGYQVPDYARKPANLTFVIDVSGSMDMDNRLGLVKQSLELLVRRLTQQDSVAIIVYGSDAHMVLEPTSAYFKDTILQAIRSLQIEGSTNAEAGLRLGYKTAMRSFRQDSINRVILCSDGVANTGATSSDEILNFVHGYVEEGVTLTTMGFGMGNFNDALLEQLADKGNGNYNYIDTLDEARKLFVENLTSTLQVIGKDAKVQVDFNPDVVSYYRLIGYENRAVADEDFRDNSVDAGEVGAGHSVVAMYAVHFKPGAEGRVATLQLRWEDPDTYEVQETDGILNTWDIARSYADASPRYRLAVTVMQFAEVLRQSPWGEETGLDVISEYASGLRSEIHDQEVTEFADLVWQAARIERRSW